MNLKEELKKMRDRLSEIPKEQLKTDGTEEKRIIEGAHKFSKRYISLFDKASDNNIKNIDLDDKVDDYIEWNYENMVKGNYTAIGEYRVPIELRNFIEKMAVWYELRYPDYEINRLMPGSGQEVTEISDVMFNSNNYINELFDKNDDVRAIDWDKFYNTHAFIKSLPGNEKYYLEKAKYSDYTRLFIDDYREIIICLTSNGCVKEIRETYLAPINGKYLDSSELIGMNIKDVIVILKEKYNCTDKQLKCMIEEINDYDNKIMFKEELLNCVMYRIIERGGNRVGPRRALLFAKEFGRNIDIPMMYGVDYSDPGLREFVNEYIKAGGSKDLLCYEGYFSRANKEESMNTVSVRELIKDIDNDCVTKYTPEETALHQRLVNVLSNKIDQEELKKEEVQQLRLQRKLNKSRYNKKTI